MEETGNFPLNSVFKWYRKILFMLVLFPTNNGSRWCSTHKKRRLCVISCPPSPLPIPLRSARMLTQVIKSWAHSSPQPAFTLLWFSPYDVFPTGLIAPFSRRIYLPKSLWVLLLLTSALSEFVFDLNRRRSSSESCGGCVCRVGTAY